MVLSNMGGCMDDNLWNMIEKMRAHEKIKRELMKMVKKLTKIKNDEKGY